MKSRILSRDKILICFDDSHVKTHFTASYTGSLFPTENPLRFIAENTPETVTFLQDYVIDKRLEETDSVIVEDASTDNSPAMSTESLVERSTCADDSTLANRSTPCTTVSTDVSQRSESTVAQQRPPVDLTILPAPPVAPPTIVSQIPPSTVVSEAIPPPPPPVFRPIAASPTEEYELDAELFRLRRSLAKIEKAQREFIVFSRRSLSEKQIHRLERIINYTQRIRQSIQPDL